MDGRDKSSDKPTMDPIGSSVIFERDPVVIQRGEQSKSPVHIHLTDMTPIHVHVKKPKKPQFQDKSTKLKTTDDIDLGNLRNSTVASRARSRSPGSGAVSKSTAKRGYTVTNRSKSPGVKYTWQGPTHRLDIHQTARKVDEEDEGVDDDSLEKLDHHRVLREIEKKDDLLETSRRVLEKQEVELEKCKYELEATELENLKLRRNMEKICDDIEGSRIEPEFPTDFGRDKVIRKLIDTELDVQTLSKQLSTFVDSLRYIREDRPMTYSDMTALMKQKDLLDDRLECFDKSNRALRALLRNQQEQQLSTAKLSEQRDVLLARLAHLQDAHHILRGDLLESDHQIADLRVQLEAQKEENLAINGQQSNLKITKAHLQNQLKQKEADCNRMAVQIRTLESQLAQERIDVEHLRGLLSQAKERVDLDKEALKKATRAQKLRATKSEDALEQAKLQLMERDAVNSEQRAEVESLRSQLSKLGREKAQADAELSAHKIRIRDLENVMERIDYETKGQVESASSKIQEKTVEASSLRLENERLKTLLSSVEAKLMQADADVTQLRISLREYEGLVDDYRTQINRSRREADNSMTQLEELKHETFKVKHASEMELDQMKSRLQSRLLELDSVPEMLRSTEMKLHEANEKLRLYDVRHTENVKLINDLTAKANRQTDQLSDTRERTHRTEEENRSLAARMEMLDKKISSLEDQNRELTTISAKQEEALHQTNLRLEEKTNDNASLQRQLDTAIADIRRQKDQERDRLSATERSNQTRILDLEAQLSQSKGEVSRIKREKEESERKFNSRLFDLKDRLEQSYSTNRTMQNYVQFLKNSYATAFNDPALLPAPSPARTSFF